MKPNIINQISMSGLVQSILTIIVGLLIALIVWLCLKPLSKKLKSVNNETFIHHLTTIIFGLLLIVIIVSTVLSAINLYKDPIKGIGNYHVKKTYVVGIEAVNDEKSTLTLINEHEDDPYQIYVSKKQAQILHDGQVLEIKTNKQILRKSDLKTITLSDFKDSNKDVYFKIDNASALDSNHWIKPDEKG